jgi:hypothetical protein
MSAFGTKRTPRDVGLLVCFWGKADIGRSRCLFWSDAIHPQQPHRLTTFDARLPIDTIGLR